MDKSRVGTVTILGAGASVDAGYATAAEFLDPFLRNIKDATAKEIKGREEYYSTQEEIRKKEANLPPGKGIIHIPLPGPTATTEEWFQEQWESFISISGKLRPLLVPKQNDEGRPQLGNYGIRSPRGGLAFPPYSDPIEGEPISPPPTPYLENFFAFYDNYMRPIIVATVGDPGRLKETSHRFRKIRGIAIKTAYQTLSTFGKETVDYLTSLFRLQGPDNYKNVIATLNFDVGIEQIAHKLNTNLVDGFSNEPGKIFASPPEWSKPGCEKFLKLWNVVEKNCHTYIGHTHNRNGSILLLKLHGSLGWFVIEEGGGDIGSRDELRHNTIYKYFRIPLEYFWNPDMEKFIDQVATGGKNDPVIKSKKDSISRKAGAIWVRPYIVYARSLKTHPDHLFLEQITLFTQLLDKAKNVLVVGYSWGDPHINDLIFDAVARGANLINVSKGSKPQYVLALWMHRFPTTFHHIQERLYMFGGGAKQVFSEGVIELPSGENKEINLVKKINQGLSVDLSLAKTLKG